MAILALVASACSGGSKVTNAAPRISNVPLQSTAGGSSFTLDLADYVADREGATLTFAVTAGGGSFTGSTYANMFDSMGTHTVAFTVSDGSKTSTGTFEVKVTSADLVVVKEDSNGLFLLDSGTNKQVRVTAASATPSFATGLGDGRLVYQIGTPSQLWVFDPMTRRSERLGTDSAGAATYRAKTS
ncbi:MAG: hypothetical protein KDC98_25980, partial [Planctomycetes bacterium]|nr:hypothetical protein [Planctomycetota bacterium]